MRMRIVIVAVLITLGLFPGVASAQDTPQSLGALLHHVEEKSPDLSAAQARLESAQAAVKIVKSRYFGRVELSASDSHFNDPRPINQSLPPLTDKNQIDYGAVLTVPIDINGRITAQYRAQKHLSDASAHNAENVKLTLFEKTATLYRGLQKLEGIKTALTKQKEALDGHYKITKASINAGRTAKVELLRIKAEISAVEGKLAGLHGDEQALRAGLAALLDQKSFIAPVVSVSVMTLPVGLPEGEVNISRSRPDILASESSKKAKHERLKDAQREWLPTLSMQAAVEKEKGYDTNSEDSASITGRLSWELWDGGRRFATTDKAVADLVVANNTKYAAENRALSEIIANKAEWEARKTAYNAAETGLEAAAETARIQGDLYENGRVSAVDLIDVEAALAQARSNLTSSMADWWLADDRLNIALGRPPSSYGAE